MAIINETDFFKGALWAADILLSTTHCAGANDEVRDILEHIPNLYSVVMRTPETEVHDLRLYADKEFPLGLNAEYTAISIAPLKDFFDILPVTEHELDCEAMDIETWGVVADLTNGKKDLLIAGLLSPETAQMYADRLSEQLAFQQRKAS